MDIKALFMVLLMGFSANAQMSEISRQYVAFGDYVQQYAVVQIASSSGTYQTPCVDCTATANVTLNGAFILTDQSMEQIQTGLFGFRASAQTLRLNHTYFMRVTTVSTSKGTGFTDSYFSIIPKDDARALSASASSTATASDSSSIWDYTVNLIENAVKKTVETLISPLTDIIDKTGLKNTFKFILEFVTWTLTIIWAIFGVLQSIFMVLILLIKDPKTESEIIYSWLMNGAIWIGSAFFLTLMCFETIIIAMSIRKNDLLDTLSEWVKLHFSMIGMGAKSFGFMFNITRTIIKTILDVISQINPIGRGT